MNEIGLLVKALIKENPHEALIRERKYLEYALKHLKKDAEESYTEALEAALLYDTKNGKCPDSLASLLTYANSNPHQESFFEQKLPILQEQLKELEVDDAPVAESVMLMEAVYQRGLQRDFAGAYQSAALISSGAATHPKTKEKGPKAAEQYLRERREARVVKTPKVVSGDLAANADYIQSIFDSYILADESRMFTGFNFIDQCVIGRRQPNRWIGILGYTNHGKTLLLMSMLYNIARSGKNVLFVPREFSVDEAYMMFAIIHGINYPELMLCSRAEWIKHGSRVEEVYPGVDKSVRILTRDLKEGNTLKGKLIVEPLSTWGEIVEHMNATVDQVDYDVLAIDYFTHLDVKGKDVVEEHKKNFRAAQMLSRDGIRNDKSGLVIITPLQANKKGHDEAAKQEGDAWGEYQSLGAIDWYTQAAQDMDLVISTWFEGDKLRELNPPQMIIRCMKARGGPMFPTHRVELNETLGYLCDIGSMVRSASSEEISAGFTDSEADAVLYTSDQTWMKDVED